MKITASTSKDYKKPEIRTLSAAQLLEALGPAHCGYGPHHGGGGHGHDHGHGHGHGHGHH